MVAGLLGIGAGLSGFVPALSFLPAPFNIALLSWLIALGFIGRERGGSHA